MSKTYKKRQVVKSVSLTIASSEIIGLLGPNGAGKTTSFYMISGLILADSGTVTLIDDTGTKVDLSQLPMYQRSQYGIGYLPQDSSIFPSLTVAENIMAALEYNPKVTRKHRKHRLNQLLEEVQISHLKDIVSISISGGERRRLEVARALAMDPKFMLLDEPFAGVDPISIGDIIQIIDYLKNKGVGILISDHNVQETLKICDRSYVLGEGQIIAHGSAEDIVNNQLIRQTYLGENFSL